MADTVSKTFNDPSSYEFISMQVDTVKGKDDYDNLKKYSTNAVLFDSAARDKMKVQLAQIENNPGYMDSVFNYIIHVSFRSKNKLGALATGQMRLKYLPQIDKMELMK